MGAPTVVGLLDLDSGSVEGPSAPGLTMNVYTAAGTPTAGALRILASWAASPEALPNETAATPAS